MKEGYKILVAEDEEDMCEILQFNLESEGHRVDAVHSAEEALKKDLADYDLLLLDVMMGRMSGFSLAQKVRKELQLDMPIIFLTARTAENDLLTGLNVGADDYVTKPFSIRELQARIKTVLRRTGRKAKTEESLLLRAGGVVVDKLSKRLIIDNNGVNLTKKEFEIVAYLAQHPGRMFSRSEILAHIWGNEVIVTDRTVDVTIARLRKKMGEYGGYVKNKAGYGYYFEI